MAITVTALLDRFLPAVLMEPIKRDLNLSDTSISLIQGYAFALFYCLAGLPLARMIDRGNRRNLIIAGVLVWSGMTLGCSLARTYSELFIARAGVGIAEAVLAPCAYSIIADCFPRHLRGRAIGLFYGSQSIGSSASFMLGGLIFDRLSRVGGLHLPLIGIFSPWRATFAIAAIPGFVVALLAFGFKEPVRQEAGVAAGAEGVLPFLRSNVRCLLPLYATFGIIAFLALIGPSWAAAFYNRIHDVPLVNSGMIVGLILLFSGVAGPLAGGIIGDRWALAHPGGRFRLPLLSLMIGVPLFALWPLVPMLGLSYVVLAASVTVLSLGLSTAPAIIQEIAPNSVRARALAINQILQFITTGFSPTAVALLTDHLFGDPKALPYSITLTALVGGAAGLIICLAAMKPYRLASASASRKPHPNLFPSSALP